MWVASKYGWFSIVRKKDGYHVRARLQKDLESLIKGVKGLNKKDIKCWDKADYRYRIVTKDDGIITKLFFKLGESIDYDNFKDSLVHNKQGDKASYYTRIWAIMQDYQIINEIINENFDDDNPEMDYYGSFA